GLGQVGGRLAVRLSTEGALLTVTDVNSARQHLAAELGATWVEPGLEHLVPADVFVPAGIGGLLTDDVIDALDTAAVCGPANNPLASREGAERLAARGILYAPDFRSEEHTSEHQSRENLVYSLLLEIKKLEDFNIVSTTCE